mmetsp:Transcript_90334/g.279448  ORF Transcript_90334/g.279448 Transcript_90334/m.279448 type:complete len:206 (-) Transcript_90334:529-1146(-)
MTAVPSASPSASTSILRTCCSMESPLAEPTASKPMAPLISRAQASNRSGFWESPGWPLRPMRVVCTARVKGEENMCRVERNKRCASTSHCCSPLPPPSGPLSRRCCHRNRKSCAWHTPSGLSGWSNATRPRRLYCSRAWFHLDWAWRIRNRRFSVGLLSMQRRKSLHGSERTADSGSLGGGSLSSTGSSTSRPWTLASAASCNGM